MRAFLDFEASSLSHDSYPIEVGWVFEDGAAEAHLIRPAPGWTDWDPTAEALHGLSRAQLQAEGEPHEAVARRTLAALTGHELFVSAPSWDGKWMSLLLRTAGLPRHALRVRDSDEAHRAAAAEVLRGRIPEAEVAPLAAALLGEARQAILERGARHRALPDAEDELAVWREVRRLAEQELAGRAA
jgi:hypothetical protein